MRGGSCDLLAEQAVQRRLAPRVGREIIANMEDVLETDQQPLYSGRTLDLPGREADHHSLPKCGLLGGAGLGS